MTKLMIKDNQIIVDEISTSERINVNSIVSSSALPAGASTSAKQLPDGHDVRTIEANGVPAAYNKQTGVSELFNIQKGQLNKMRLRPEILNEHAESSREIQAEVKHSIMLAPEKITKPEDAGT